MNVVEITKKLISIPSFVDKENNEEEIAQWIYNYLEENTNLSVRKQFIGGNRFNVYATNNNNPEILITGHMDTVYTKAGWLTDPFDPIVKDCKIYGLGSSDMKGGLAAVLASIPKDISTKVGFLFYCDEEYDFLGMKKFIDEYKGKINPKLIVSADGELKLGNSCRGLVELTVKVAGKTGHSSNPKLGINAICGAMNTINNLSKWLKGFSSQELGKTTLNIAYISGGTNLGQNSSQVVLGKEGNLIADYCEFVLEIRNASLYLNALKVKEFLSDNLTKRGLRIIDIKVRHDLGSWTTPLSEIEKLGYTGKILSAKKRGYIDIQMLWEAFGKVPTISFGAGEKGTAHKENEYVKISSLEKLEKFYSNLIINNKMI